MQDGAGLCSIWRFRNGICSTRFCKIQRGKIGLSFWNACSDFLTTVERITAVWCASELGVSSNLVRSAKGGMSEWHIPQRGSFEGDLARNATPQQLWRDWNDRRAEFYGKCASLARTLKPEDIEREGGIELRLQAQTLKAEFEKMMTVAIPERLAAAPISILGRSDDGVNVVGYRGTDPQLLSTPLFNVLRHFVGQPVGEALSTIEMETGVRLSEDLLLRLTDTGVLDEPQRLVPRMPGRSEEASARRWLEIE
jgi:hypothetical protein